MVHRDVSVGGEPVRVELGDGRVIEALTAGPGAATALVYHGGTPTAATLFGPLVAAARRRGLPVVTFSRPGYAGSTPQPGRAVADAAADTAAVLDALGAGSFVTIGWSGGGPHALACAALLPERCMAAVSLAGPAPYDADGIDWLAGMGPENIAEFSSALAGQASLTAYLENEATGLAEVSPAEVADALGGLVSEVDKAAITRELATFLAETFRRAVSAGITGWRDDDLAFVRGWGFDLNTIARPVAVWQGGEDRMVPFHHGRWLADHIPGAAARLRPAEGHLSLIAYIEEIVDDLVDLADRG